MHGGFSDTLRDHTPSMPDPVMPAQATSKIKLPKNASRIIYVKGLPAKVSNDDLYDIFGKYGSIRQIRVGVAPNTKGTGYVVYDDICDAKNAVDHLNGFNVAGRYIAVSYFTAPRPDREEKKLLEEELRIIREKSGFI
ncbi:putative RNA-binding protein [Gregarina niphandrodes]|uniref:RNA-binding protein n=1 Tax=Gregarina niphandrodes TaxID=110365 RepID=A0A023B3B6_GRENI|nr:putative RNA-binding protein [Gregarina niphandrodes]EZG55391.1 putative RNA-binding protein [Gregarina niphandrodes]|eukprot:XP_011131591.1 putative RNA-binding protein [Gregarina niphandrodes]